MNGTIVMRVAGADVLPFEFGNLAETVARYGDELEALAKKNQPPPEAGFRIDLMPLSTAVKSLSESARRYESAFAKSAVRGFAQVKDLKALNAVLIQSERKLTNEQGLPQR